MYNKRKKEIYLQNQTKRHRCSTVIFVDFKNIIRIVSYMYDDRLPIRALCTEYYPQSQFCSDLTVSITGLIDATVNFGANFGIL